VLASSGLANEDGDSSPCSAINLRAVRLEGLVAPLCLGANLLEFGFRAQRGQAGIRSSASTRSNSARPRVSAAEELAQQPPLRTPCMLGML